jgi:hypothetical protein
MIKLKNILFEAKKMRGVTIGDKFIDRQRSSKEPITVIDFYVTKNIKVNNCNRFFRTSLAVYKFITYSNTPHFFSFK